MCGIAGIVSTSSRPSVDLVHRMCDVIAHRGPDGAGFHDDDNAALGMRRLAIIDVSGGQQPVSNEDGTVIAVFNGELYNFPQLQAELTRRGHQLKSDGDSECLVHLYEEYGDELVHRLRGMFAFAIWDKRRGRLLLARDRVGKKPLYWRADGDSIRFASELKSLLQDPAVPRSLDLVAMHHYLTYQYVPAPWSIYEGISKLPPGHLLVWQGGRTEVRPYWRLDFTPRTVTDEEHEAERLRELLLDAVKVRLVSERPLGAFLSGGIDSAAVVAAMAQSSGERVKTFSIGFDNPDFDERRYARAVASRYDTDHHELVVSPRALDVLPTLVWHFDEPFADSSAIPSFYVAQLSRQHVTVVLTGDGGDECFGGYSRYRVFEGLNRARVPAPLRPAMSRLSAAVAARAVPGHLRGRVGGRLRMLGEPPSRVYGTFMSYFASEQKTALYTDELRARLAGVDSYQLLDDVFDASRADTVTGRAIDSDVNMYLPGDLLAKVDISTMANSLEARAPFLDHLLMEWAAGLPTRLKVRRDSTKYLLRRAVAPWLPAELMDRPKMGFAVPLASWLRGELRDLAHDVLTDGTARARGLFRPDAVATLLREHDEGVNHASRLWALIQLELWQRTFLDDRSGAAASGPLTTCSSLEAGRP